MTVAVAAMAFVVGAVIAALVARRGLNRAVAGLETAAGIEAPGPGEPPLPRIRRVTNRLVGAEAEVGEDEARLRAVLDLAPDGIVVVDADGAVVHANPAGALVGDARHEEVLVAAAVDDAVAVALGGEEATRSVELFGPPARTVHVRSTPIGPSAEPVGAVALVHDESRIRRLEEIRQAFVANVSHELKTPIGGLALLGEAMNGVEDPTQLRAMAERMTAECHRVAHVIDDLLELSQIESGDGPDHRAVAVGEVIDSAIEAVRLLADEAGVAIEVDDRAETACAHGDRVQLASAVTNLLDNAVKYSGGTSPVRVWSRVEGDMVEIGVTDHGLGIPQADLERIFERFYRVDRARSRDTGGTGLGLSIVRNVARRHDGHVEVRSREGDGSTFVLRLPLASTPRTVPVRTS